MNQKTKTLSAISGVIILAAASSAAAWGVGVSLHSGADEQYCIDARGDGKGAGTEVWMFNCNHTEAQKWAFSRWTDDQGNLIGPGGLCVSAHDGKTAYMYGCNGGDNQKFKHDAGRFVHKESGKCLTVPIVGDKQPLVLADCDSTPKQIWKIKTE